MEQSSVETSNQQERLVSLAWLAGLYEGEGNFSLVQGSGSRLMPRIGLINTDESLIEAAHATLVELGIGHYIQTRRGGCDGNPKHKDAKVILVAGCRRVATLLNLLLPLIRGKKRAVAEIVKAYAEYRLSLPGRHSPYTTKDYEYVSAVRALNAKGTQVSSETVRCALEWFQKKIQSK